MHECLVLLQVIDSKNKAKVFFFHYESEIIYCSCSGTSYLGPGLQFFFSVAMSPIWLLCSATWFKMVHVSFQPSGRGKGREGHILPFKCSSWKDHKPLSLTYHWSEVVTWLFQLQRRKTEICIHPLHCVTVCPHKSIYHYGRRHE